jgi:DNA/RNA-binding domain of Phe-tRNA-synthetase-like protein
VVPAAARATLVAVTSPPFEVRSELPGWTLFWAGVERSDEFVDDALAALRRDVVERVRDRLAIESLAKEPAVAAMRRLFKAVGTDPGRYRPASEALVRRLLKGSDLPVIHPLVDLNNCLSVELLAPCCAMADGTTTPPFVWRAGAAGESYDSLRGGAFDLEKRPVLADAEGPCDVPITGSQRVKVTADTRNAVIVSYLPADVVDAATADEALRGLVRDAPGLRVLWTGAS